MKTKHFSMKSVISMLLAVIMLLGTFPTISVLCPPSKNGHKKASKNEMNRSISLIY